jgi:ferritin-like metal-binding protein YciE
MRSCGRTTLPRNVPGEGDLNMEQRAVSHLLVRQLNEALALEFSWKQTVEARIDQGDDGVARAELARQVAVIKGHVTALEEEITRLDGEIDDRKSGLAGAGANLKAVVDSFRDDHVKDVEDAVDDYVTLQTEIAVYMALEAMAEQAQAVGLTTLARRHREDVEGMAAWHWRKLQHAARAAVV